MKSRLEQARRQENKRSGDAADRGGGDVRFFHPRDVECVARAGAREGCAVNVLVYLVPMALGLGLAGLGAFMWSLRNGQYDDMDGAALRVLDDDDVEHA